MYDFFTHTAILLWSIIGTIIGAVALIFVCVYIIHEVWVFVDNAISNPENEESES